jgi:hypothetical protein
VLGAIALVALLALVATRGTGRAVVAPETGWRRPLPVPAAAPPAPEPVPIESVRDPFRYADLPRVPPPAPPPVRAAAPVPLPTPTPEPAYRLVGVVARGGRLRAALSIGGEIVLLAPGETAGGVTVLAVHEDGVRLRGPDGRDEVIPQS